MARRWRQCPSSLPPLCSPGLRIPSSCGARVPSLGTYMTPAILSPSGALLWQRPQCHNCNGAEMALWKEARWCRVKPRPRESPQQRLLPPSAHRSSYLQARLFVRMLQGAQLEGLWRRASATMPASLAARRRALHRSPLTPQAVRGPLAHARLFARSPLVVAHSCLLAHSPRAQLGALHSCLHGRFPSALAARQRPVLRVPRQFPQAL
mmetsp:Transcript_68740/g.154519  ORF Transcript_68740/g.154519 Transcript_68740/m.154519 type:complete len:208 (+) Transcript_68740:270-893(+)